MAGEGMPGGLDDHIYNRLLKERIIFLGSEVRDENANAICAQMLLLAAEDPEKDIWLYINSPGGSVTAGMAIFDTMQWVKPDVATVAMGMAASMGQFLLSAGTPGKRYATPARPGHDAPAAPAASAAPRRTSRSRPSRCCTSRSRWPSSSRSTPVRPLDQIEKDSDRDRWFTAEAARAYGFVDHVVERASSAGASIDNPVG